MSLQNYWIELDQIIQDIASRGVNTEMQEKRAIEKYIKALGSSSRSSVIQERTDDGRSVRIYTWMDTPIGNIALVTGRETEPQLHYLIPEEQNADSDVYLVIKGKFGRPDLVSVDIPHEIEEVEYKAASKPRNTASRTLDIAKDQMRSRKAPRKALRKSKSFSFYSKNPQKDRRFDTGLSLPSKTQIIKASKRRKRRNPIESFQRLIDSIPNSFSIVNLSNEYPIVYVYQSFNIGEDQKAVVYRSDDKNWKKNNVELALLITATPKSSDTQEITLNFELRDKDNKRVYEKFEYIYPVSDVKKSERELESYGDIKKIIQSTGTSLLYKTRVLPDLIKKMNEWFDNPVKKSLDTMVAEPVILDESDIPEVTEEDLPVVSDIEPEEVIGVELEDQDILDQNIPDNVIDIFKETDLSVQQDCDPHFAEVYSPYERFDKTWTHKGGGKWGYVESWTNSETPERAEYDFHKGRYRLRQVYVVQCVKLSDEQYDQFVENDEILYSLPSWLNTDQQYYGTIDQTREVVNEKGFSDLYEILRVKSDATPKEIKKSYRRLAIQMHPDRNTEDPQATEKFLELKDAFELLDDPKQKSSYDARRSRFVEIVGQRVPYAVEVTAPNRMSFYAIFGNRGLDSVSFDPSVADSLEKPASKKPAYGFGTILTLTAKEQEEADRYRELRRKPPRDPYKYMYIDWNEDQDEMILRQANNFDIGREFAEFSVPLYQVDNDGKNENASYEVFAVHDFPKDSQEITTIRWKQLEEAIWRSFFKDTNIGSRWSMNADKNALYRGLKAFLTAYPRRAKVSLSKGVIKAKDEKSAEAIRTVFPTYSLSQRFGFNLSDNVPVDWDQAFKLHKEILKYLKDRLPHPVRDYQILPALDDDGRGKQVAMDMVREALDYDSYNNDFSFGWRVEFPDQLELKVFLSNSTKALDVTITVQRYGDYSFTVVKNGVKVYEEDEKLMRSATRENEPIIGWDLRRIVADVNTSLRQIAKEFDLYSDGKKPEMTQEQKKLMIDAIAFGLAKKLKEATGDEYKIESIPKMDMTLIYDPTEDWNKITLLHSEKIVEAMDQKFDLEKRSPEEFISWLEEINFFTSKQSEKNWELYLSNRPLVTSDYGDGVRIADSTSDPTIVKLGIKKPQAFFYWIDIDDAVKNKLPEKYGMYLIIQGEDLIDLIAEMITEDDDKYLSKYVNFWNRQLRGAGVNQFTPKYTQLKEQVRMRLDDLSREHFFYMTSGIKEEIMNKVLAVVKETAEGKEVSQKPTQQASVEEPKTTKKQYVNIKTGELVKKVPTTTKCKLKFESGWDEGSDSKYVYCNDEVVAEILKETVIPSSDGAKKVYGYTVKLTLPDSEEDIKKSFDVKGYFKDYIGFGKGFTNRKGSDTAREALTKAKNWLRSYFEKIPDPDYVEYTGQKIVVGKSDLIPDEELLNWIEIHRGSVLGGIPYGRSDRFDVAMYNLYTDTPHSDVYIDLNNGDIVVEPKAKSRLTEKQKEQLTRFFSELQDSKEEYEARRQAESDKVSQEYEASKEKAKTVECSIKFESGWGGDDQKLAYCDDIAVGKIAKFDTEDLRGSRQVYEYEAHLTDEDGYSKKKKSFKVKGKFGFGSFVIRNEDGYESARKALSDAKKWIRSQIKSGVLQELLQPEQPEETSSMPSFDEMAQVVRDLYAIDGKGEYLKAFRSLRNGDFWSDWGGDEYNEVYNAAPYSYIMFFDALDRKQPTYKLLERLATDKYWNKKHKPIISYFEKAETGSYYTPILTGLGAVVLKYIENDDSAGGKLYNSLVNQEPVQELPPRSTEEFIPEMTIEETGKIETDGEVIADLTFKESDFTGIKNVHEKSLSKLQAIFHKKLPLEPLCEKLHLIFISDDYEWCSQPVISHEIKGKYPKKERCFGLRQKDLPESDKSLVFAFGITVQDRSIRVRMGTLAKSGKFASFVPAKDYKFDFQYVSLKSQIKDGLKVKGILAVFFRELLEYTLENEHALAKIQEYCSLISDNLIVITDPEEAKEVISQPDVKPIEEVIEEQEESSGISEENLRNLADKWWDLATSHPNKKLRLHDDEFGELLAKKLTTLKVIDKFKEIGFTPSKSGMNLTSFYIDFIGFRDSTENFKLKFYLGKSDKGGMYNTVGTIFHPDDTKSVFRSYSGSLTLDAIRIELNSFHTEVKHTLNQKSQEFDFANGLNLLSSLTLLETYAKIVQDPASLQVIKEDLGSQPIVVAHFENFSDKEIKDLRELRDIGYIKGGKDVNFNTRNAKVVIDPTDRLQVGQLRYAKTVEGYEQLRSLLGDIDKAKSVFSQSEERKEDVQKAEEKPFEEEVTQEYMGYMLVDPMSELDQIHKGRDRAVVSMQTCNYLKKNLNSLLPDHIKIKVRTNRTGSMKHSCSVSGNITKQGDLAIIIETIRRLGFQGFQIGYGEDFSLEKKWLLASQRTEEQNNMPMEYIPNAYTVIPMEFDQKTQQPIIVNWEDALATFSFPEEKVETKVEIPEEAEVKIDKPTEEVEPLSPEKQLEIIKTFKGVYSEDNRRHKQDPQSNTKNKEIIRYIKKQLDERIGDFLRENKVKVHVGFTIGTYEGAGYSVVTTSGNTSRYVAGVLNKTLREMGFQKRDAPPYSNRFGKIVSYYAKDLPEPIGTATLEHKFLEYTNQNPDKIVNHALSGSMHGRYEVNVIPIEYSGDPVNVDFDKSLALWEEYDAKKYAKQRSLVEEEKEVFIEPPSEMGKIFVPYETWYFPDEAVEVPNNTVMFHLNDDNNTGDLVVIIDGKGSYLSFHDAKLKADNLAERYKKTQYPLSSMGGKFTIMASGEDGTLNQNVLNSLNSLFNLVQRGVLFFSSDSDTLPNASFSLEPTLKQAVASPAFREMPSSFTLFEDEDLNQVFDISENEYGFKFERKYYPLFDAKNVEYSVIYELAILDTDGNDGIQISNIPPSFKPNPDYYEPFQARDLGQPEEMDKIRRIANNLNSKQMFKSGVATFGSPIVWNEDGKDYVLAGNGRSLSLALISKDQYIDYLKLARKEFPDLVALNAEKIQDIFRSSEGRLRPIVVRQVFNADHDRLSKKEAVKLAGASQGSTSAEETPLRKAVSFVRSLGLERMDQKRIPTIQNPMIIDSSTVEKFQRQNSEFSNWFGNQLIGLDKSQYNNPNKNTLDNIARMINSFLVAEYLPQDVIAEGFVNRSQEETLMNILPILASMEQQTRNGTLRPEYNLLPYLSEARKFATEIVNMPYKDALEFYEGECDTGSEGSQQRMFGTAGMATWCNLPLLGVGLAVFLKRMMGVTNKELLTKGLLQYMEEARSKTFNVAQGELSQSDVFGSKERESWDKTVADYTQLAGNAFLKYCLPDTVSKRLEQTKIAADEIKEEPEEVSSLFSQDDDTPSLF